MGKINKQNASNKGQEVDYMNPEAADPTIKEAKKRIKNSKLYKELAKKIKKALKEITKKIGELIANTMPWSLILIILLVLIIFIICAISAWDRVGAVLGAKFNDIVSSVFGTSFTLTNGAVDNLDNQDIVDTANYLEEMGYDIIGYGFVKPMLRSDDNGNNYETIDELLGENSEYTYKQNDDDGKWHFYKGDDLSPDFYYNSLGMLVNNETGEVVTSDDTYTDMYGVVRSTTDLNENGEGKVVLTDTIENNLSKYRLIRTYLLSNYRIYTLRNNDERFLPSIYAALKSIFGGYQDAWCKGLINIYVSDNGIAEHSWLNDFGDELNSLILGESIKLDNNTFQIKAGRFDNAMVYSTAGWHARYGLSLDFLISLHIGTMAPDLVYAMVQNFDTEVQVYLNDMGDSTVESKYIDPSDEDSQEVTLETISKATDNALEGWLVQGDDGTFTGSIREFLGSIGFTKHQALGVLIKTGLESPDTCTGKELTYVVEADSAASSVNTKLEGQVNSGNDAVNYLNEYYGYNSGILQEVRYYNKGKSKDDVKEMSSYNTLNSARFMESEGLFQKSNMDYIDEDKLTEKYESEGKANETEILQAMKDSKISEYDELENEIKNRKISELGSNTLYTIKGSEIAKDYTIYGYYDTKAGEFNYVTADEAKAAQEENGGDGTINGYLVEEETIEFNSFLYYIYTDASNILDEDDDANKEVLAIKKFVFSTDYSYDVTGLSGRRDGNKTYTIVFLKDTGTGEYSYKIFEDFKGDGTDVDLVSDGKARITESGSGGVIQNLGDLLGNNESIDFNVEIDEKVTAVEDFMMEIGESSGTKKEYDKLIFTLTVVKNNNTTGSSYYYELKHKSSKQGRYVSDSETIYTQTSKNKDSGLVLVDILWCNYVIRNRTAAELEAVGYTNDEGKCSSISLSDYANGKIKNCCTNCQLYVKAVIKALANIKDSDYSSYTPYIARVVGSWFRDTYFVVPSVGANDAAIDEYADNHKEFDRSSAEGTSVSFVQVDEEYLAESGEYWTSYETKDDGSYQLYFLNADGTTSNTTLERFLKCEVADGDSIPTHSKYNTQEEAEADGWAFVKKAKLKSVTTMSSYSKDNKLLWSAYTFSSDGATTGWIRVDYNEDGTDGNEYVNKVYDMVYESAVDANADTGSGFFYKLDSSNTIEQEEDAQRGETNALIKYLFKYRKYYIYDGTQNTAVWIEHDRNRVLYGYSSYVEEYDADGDYYNGKVLAESVNGYTGSGSDFYKYQGVIPYLQSKYGADWATTVSVYLNSYGRSALRQAYSGLTSISLNDEDTKIEIAEQWLEWQLDMYYMKLYGVDLNSYYGSQIKLLWLDYDPRDPDLVSTVNITKSSLNAFDILESSGSIDAEYQLRDFKELIVELNYFDKEDLSSKISSVFTWVLPGVDSGGWPIRPYDKQDTEYGALIESHNTYVGLGAYADSDSTENQVLVTTSSNDISYEKVSNSSSDEKCDRIITAYGTKFYQFNQSGGAYSSLSLDSIRTDESGTTLSTSGCGIYSVTSLLSGYTTGTVNPGETISYIKTNYGGSAFNNDGTRASTMNSFLNDNGVSGKWYTATSAEEYEKLITEAFEAGKPVIVNIKPGSGSPWTTGGGHYFCAIGTYDGNVYTVDSVAGSNDARIKNTLDSFLDAVCGHLNRGVWIPDEAPSAQALGSYGKAVFQGYENDDLVASPITGKVLEYGTHTRINSYTGESEEVRIYSYRSSS